MDNLDQRISELEERIKGERQYLPFAEGQQYYRTKQDIAELEKQLTELKSNRK